MKWHYRTPGIPDDCFITGDVPMTKSEIRVLSLSKLRIEENSRILDVGCGTGSITVEAALQCPGGKVVAVDCKEEALDLTARNVEKFELENVALLWGRAPEKLPRACFDRIFVGGGGKDLPGIVEYARQYLEDKGIIVINTILLDSACCALNALESGGFKDIQCICAGIARGEKLSGWMMKALNPIYILSACKPG